MHGDGVTAHGQVCEQEPGYLDSVVDELVTCQQGYVCLHYEYMCVQLIMCMYVCMYVYMFHSQHIFFR